MSYEIYEPDEDTWLLLDCVKGLKVSKALEIGIGSGIISFELAKTCEEVHGVDINPFAVKLVTEKAKRNKIKNVKFWVSDLFDNVKEKYDLIVFNPPYLPGSPKTMIERSWLGGRDGREVIERFLSEVRRYLKVNGSFFLVLSSINKPDDLIKKFHLRIIKRKKLFFEELICVKGLLKG